MRVVDLHCKLLLTEVEVLQLFPLEKLEERDKTHIERVRESKR